MSSVYLPEFMQKLHAQRAEEAAMLSRRGFIKLTGLAGGGLVLAVSLPQGARRALAQPSGGTPGACDGSFALDWTAFHAAQPAALGAPWTAHERAWLQAWFRDPPSCKTTSLSDALVLTVQP